MKAPDLVLRCYAKRDGDQWVAVCIDLCLAAQSDSFEAARRALDQQIISYVDEALTVDRASAFELLNRKAPLSQRAEYWLIRFMHGAHLMRTRIGSAFRTILPVHVGSGKDCHA